jgi:hypothetical protein
VDPGLRAVGSLEMGEPERAIPSTIVEGWFPLFKMLIFLYFSSLAAP